MRLHDEITADYNDMIYAATREEIEGRRKVFIRKWRLKHRAVADSLEEAGERLFAFTRLPPSQWRSVRTTNAIERLHEELDQDADRAAVGRYRRDVVLGAARLRSDQHAQGGWQTLATKPIDQPIDSQPETIPSCYRRSRHTEFQQHPGRHRPASRRVVISRAGTTQQQSQPCQA